MQRETSPAEVGRLPASFVEVGGVLVDVARRIDAKLTGAAAAL